MHVPPSVLAVRTFMATADATLRRWLPAAAVIVATIAIAVACARVGAP